MLWLNRFQEFSTCSLDTSQSHPFHLFLIYFGPRPSLSPTLPPPSGCSARPTFAHGEMLMERSSCGRCGSRVAALSISSSRCFKRSSNVRMQTATTVENWLQALSTGRSFITNGPLFRFRVDTAEIGDTLKLDRAGNVSVLGQVEGRMDFRRAELVHNGEVIASATTRPVGGHFLAELKLTVPISEPGWLALRIPPPNLTDEEPATPVNEFGRKLYGHSSPIYVEVDGRSAFDANVARALLQKMKTARRSIGEHGLFEDAQAKSRVLDVYDDATERLQESLER